MNKQLRLFALLLFMASAAFADGFSAVSFNRGAVNNTRTEVYASGTFTLPAWPGSDVNRGFLAHQMATQRPQGASVMWATFRFRSNGLFTAAPDSHVFFITRSISTGLSNIGQGFIVGGLSGVSQSEGGACAPGIRSQPEVWHENADGSAGNRVIGGSACSVLLQDWKTYTVTIHAAVTGYSYWIADDTGAQVAANYVNTASSPSVVKQEKASGFTVGIVFADQSPPWGFDLFDLHTGWF